MNFLNIFRKQKITNHFPNLGELWVCFFTFHPWNLAEHKVKIKKIKIAKAEATSNGIEVQTLETFNDLKIYESNSHLIGKINKFNSSTWGWIGFFETRADAIHAYNELMDKWIDVIKSNKVAEN